MKTVSNKLTVESVHSDKQPASLPLMPSDARFDGYSTPSPSDVQLDTRSAPPSVVHSDSYSVPPPIVVQPEAYGASTPSIIQPIDAFGTPSVHIVSRIPCEFDAVSAFNKCFLIKSYRRQHHRTTLSRSQLSFRQMRTVRRRCTSSRRYHVCFVTNLCACELLLQSFRWWHRHLTLHRQWWLLRHECLSCTHRYD